MLGSEFGDGSDNINSTVLGQSFWDNLKGSSNSSVRELFKSLNGASLLIKSGRDFHLEGSTSWDELGVNKNVLSDSQTVSQVSLHFVQDVLGGSSEDDTAGFWFLAFSHEGEIFISNQLNFE